MDEVVDIHLKLHLVLDIQAADEIDEIDEIEQMLNCSMIVYYVLELYVINDDIEVLDEVLDVEQVIIENLDVIE